MKSAITSFPARAITATVVAVVAAGVLAGCTTSSSSSSAGGTSQGSSTGPITIGASLSLTGLRSADGQAFQKGYLLWEHDVNARGGLLGRQVKLTILDDKSLTNNVVSNYETLIGTDHVDLTFGPYSSLLTTPASAVAARFGYAFVEGAGGAPAVFDTPFNQADRDVFDVSQPVAASMLPIVNYIETLAKHQSQKVTVAFPYTEDPFAAPPVQLAATELSRATNVTVLPNTYSPFTEPVTTSGPQQEGPAQLAAQAVAAQHPTVVILGSTDVPMVAAFVKVFQQDKYNPQIFVAASGPDQGSAFTNPAQGGVGPQNAGGIMVPNGWFPGFNNPDSQKMVNEYIAKYGGNAAGVNADVAEAYSVGEVMGLAITATGGVDNAKIIQYLHSGVTLKTVQGDVQFDALGENAKAVGFMFQWTANGSSFVQGLNVAGTPTQQFISVKPNWGTG